MSEVPTEPSFWLALVAAVSGALGGIVTAVAVVMAQKNKLDNTAAKVAEITASMEKVKAIETLTEKMAEVRKVLFKEKGGLNVLGVEDHVDICRNNQEAFGKEIENGQEALRVQIEQSRTVFTLELTSIKSSISEIKDDVTMIMATLNSEVHTEIFKSMRTSLEVNNELMAEINAKLGDAWKSDKKRRVAKDPSEEN